jgi:hypothetical protein
MKLLRVRFTLRQLMLVVAIMAVALTFLRWISIPHWRDAAWHARQERQFTDLVEKYTAVEQTEVEGSLAWLEARYSKNAAIGQASYNARMKQYHQYAAWNPGAPLPRAPMAPPATTPPPWMSRRHSPKSAVPTPSP